MALDRAGREFKRKELAHELAHEESYERSRRPKTQKAKNFQKFMSLKKSKRTSVEEREFQLLKTTYGWY